VGGRIVRNIMTFDLIFAISLHHYDMSYSQAASPNCKQALLEQDICFGQDRRQQKLGKLFQGMS